MRTVAALMAMLAVALTACGGGSRTDAAADSGPAAAVPPQGGTRAPTAIDGCSLLTRDEVRTILGQSAAGRPDAAAGFDLSCYWYAAGPTGRQLEVSVEASRLEPESALREEYNTFKANLIFREDVSGIGDEAFLAQYSGSGSALVIRTDTLLVFINTTEPDRDEILKTLGPSVLDRLR